MVPIKGLQKVSAADYPGTVSCVVFIGGCNFRCPFCHNPELVETPSSRLRTISEESLLGFLGSRRKWLDGVVFSGGEPTIYRDLPELMRKVKALGYKVKLDTNGSNPGMLQSLLREGLLDYIAMDIKAPLEKYPRVANAFIDKADIERSVRLIRKSGIRYEFRSTLVPILHPEADVMAIGHWLNGSEKLVLQQFRPGVTLDRAYERERSYSAGELRMFAEDLRPFFGRVEVRA
jgi:pyruvate formate lyase activating enzyme